MCNSVVECENMGKTRVRVDVTLDKKNMASVDSLVNSGRFRSRSHALDEAVKLLLKKETEAVKL